MSAAVPAYLLPDSFKTSERGHACVGGVDLLDLATEFGTPAFVYDEAQLKNRCEEAVRAFPGGVAYASKAFLCKGMARLAYEAGMNIDVASGGEMHVALAAGVPANRLVLHGNNKSVDELTTAVTQGVHAVVVDSFDEIDRLQSIASATNRARCLLRVTPGVEAHTHEFVMTGQEDTKFGFSIASGAAAEAAQRLNDSAAIDFAGIHCHIGSQIFETVPFGKAIERVVPLVQQYELSELCVGGGLGVPYVTGENAPTITEWATAIHAAVRNAGISEHVRITAEPGRSIVAPAGITLYSVGTIKHLPTIRTYLSVDGGMSDNPRPVLYGSGYEAFLARSPQAERPTVVTLSGKHCESGDVVIRDGALPEDVAIGDVVVTPVTGAYGHTMASNYNKVPRPPVIFVRDGEARVVVRRETFDDLVRLDV